MKKILALALAIAMVCGASPCAADGAKGRVMASFYPMYIFALNVFDGVAEVSVECMTAPDTGCLHDYQLLAKDMMRLADADALIACGAGMEGYLDSVLAQFPGLLVVDCSQGIELLCGEDDHDHAGDSHHTDTHEHAVNAHTWLDAQNAIAIVRTIAQAGCALYPEAAERISSNAVAYTERLTALDNELKMALEPLSGREIVTFHEAFPYFANAYGLRIAAVVTQEHDEALSPARIAQVIRIVEEAGDPPLFAEPQYASAAVQTIADQTGAKAYSLDPIVSGDGSLTAYEDGMRRNAATLLAAFGLDK